MTKVLDPYSRVYWRAIDDPKFVGIWEDDAALACWLRLLVAAEMAWPATASLYHGCKTTALKKLVAAGLVDPKSSHRYRIHGLDAERAQRAAASRAAAQVRWGSNAEGMRAHPNGNAEGMPSKDEHSKAKTSIDARDGLPHIDERTQQVGERLTGSPILTAGQKPLTELDRLLERHGPEKTWQAMEAAASTVVSGGLPPTWVQLIYGTRNRLEPLPTAADTRASEKEDREEADRAAFARVVEQTKARARELTQP